MWSSSQTRDVINYLYWISLCFLPLRGSLISWNFVAFGIFAITSAVEWTFFQDADAGQAWIVLRTFTLVLAHLYLRLRKSLVLDDVGVFLFFMCLFLLLDLGYGTFNCPSIAVACVWMFGPFWLAMAVWFRHVWDSIGI